MTAETKVSSCVDCGTPIIGDRPRCPAHDLHGARQRVRVANRRTPGLLAPWRVVIEVIGIVGLAFVLLYLLVKGCS